MAKHDLQIGEIRLLHLSRSAPSLLAMPGTVPPDASEAVCFSLFDYFDWLVVRKGDTLGYKACFGLEQTESNRPLVTSEYLTLFSLAGNEEVRKIGTVWREGDPFFGEADQDLSELPFLSVMMVTVLPDPLVSPKTKAHSVPIHPADVERFMGICADELRKAVREVCQKVYAALAGLQVVFQVYNCVNSGNFCVVTRSRTPELAYHISMRIRAETLYHIGDPCFPALDCSTYSLVGLFCPVDQANQTLPTQVMTQSKAEVALRLSVTNSVRNDLFRYAAGCMSEDLRGLYGRYDVTLRLDLEHFRLLYPWICAHKLGCPFPSDDETEIAEIIRLLRRSLSDQGAQCINIRLLLHMEDMLVPENSGARRKSRQNEVKKENEKVKWLIQEVKQLGDGLVYCQEEYRVCLSLLQDLWESYSGLRYPDDSFIDGNILLVQVELLLNIIKSYVGSIQRDLGCKLDYELLVRSLRFAINSIDHFQKLMLSINQQSMQAPNYEVQMHSDMEKFVVAYTEFSRRFLLEHIPTKSHGEKVPLEKHRQLIFPIITVNTTLDAIRAFPLFLLPYHASEDGLLLSNTRQERILLSIEVPENEFLGDIYTILPLICHELSHNFRILDRKRRNDDLAGYLFRRIAQFIVRRWISQTEEKNIYHAFGRLEDELYINELATLMYAAYMKRCKETHTTANIGVLLSNIRIFLVEEIFSQKEANQLQRPELTLGQVKDQLVWLCRLALDASDAEMPDWSEDYQMCRDLLAVVKDEDRDGWMRLEKLLAPLAGRLAQTVAEGHLARIKQAEEALFKQLQKDVRLEAEEQFKRIYEDTDLRTLIMGSESEMDQWIEKANDLWRSVADQFSKSNQSDALARSVQMLGYAICDMCRSVKDANHLYLLLGSWNRYQNKPYNRKVRDQLIQDYHKQIQRKIDQHYKTQDLFWLLHSSPSVHELTAPLGSDLEEETMFAQTLKRVLLSTSQRDISLILDSSTTLYREIFADLGMCVSLDLDCFGYLNVLAHNSTFQVLDSQSANIRLERMRIVCLALFSSATRKMEDALVQLQLDGQRFCARLANRLERDMTAEGRVTRGWIEIRTWIEDLLKGQKQSRSVPAFRLPLEIFSSWFDAKTSNDVVYDMYCQFKSLWILAHLINHLDKTVKSGMGHPLQQHFSELLPAIRSRWQADDMKSPESGIIQKVGWAYNNPAGIDIFLNAQERFKDTLSFVTYYYYHGWNVYGWSDRSEAETWVNALIGGASL